jgi:hypothetical protein
MQMRWLVAAVLLALGQAWPAHAADHTDGTTTLGSGVFQPDQSSDITDYFAWMSADASKVYLVLDVFPGASTSSKFSNQVKYVFHTNSQAGFLMTQTPRDIICTFTSATPQIASCWLVDPKGAAGSNVVEYATGDAGNGASPIKSSDGKLQAFAGLRDDPFFFNLAGFRNTASIVAAAIKADIVGTDQTYIKGTDTNAPGCPILTSAGRSAIVGALNKDCTGSNAAVDFFKKPNNENAVCTSKPALVTTQTTNTIANGTGNILSIAIVVDKTLLTTGGAVLSTWAATTK